MTDIFINFLARISIRDSHYKTFSRSSLNDTFANRTYQELLNMNFGPEGCTTLTITENEVLSLGARSFFLKLAIFASPQECYKFLDYIYTAIVNKTPGYYWNLLTAIKAINDHVHDTQLKHTVDHFEYVDTPCNTLFFKNVGNSSTDLLTSNVVRPAIWTLIMNVVQELKLKAETSGEDYRGQQLLIAQSLDNLAPNPKWRFLMASLTQMQLDECDPNTIQAYMFFKAITNAPLIMALSQHQQICGCEGGTYALTVAFNKEIEETTQKHEVSLLLEDQQRYISDLNTQPPPCKRLRP